MSNFYPKLFLTTFMLFQPNYLGAVELSTKKEKVEQYFIHMENPDKDAETRPSEFFKKYNQGEFIAPNVLDILTDGDKSNYEAISFGLTEKGLYCKMTDEKGKIFYGYKQLTNKDKKSLEDALEQISGE